MQRYHETTMTDAMSSLPGDAVETWTLPTPEYGPIAVHLGTPDQLKAWDPDFPQPDKKKKAQPDTDTDTDTDAASEPQAQDECGPMRSDAASATAVPATTASSAPRGLRARVRAFLDQVDQSTDKAVLVTRAGVPIARAPGISAGMLELSQPGELEPNQTGSYGRTRGPAIRLVTGPLDAWATAPPVGGWGGGGGWRLTPPPGSRAARRYQAMEQSPWKRWALPMGAGLSKAGWALLVLVVLGPAASYLMKMLGKLLAMIPWPHINWPNIPWPHIDWPDIPWPDIPWPHISLPHVDLPEWLVWMADHPKLWVPIVVGVGLGVGAVRRNRRSRSGQSSQSSRPDQPTVQTPRDPDRP